MPARFPPTRGVIFDLDGTLVDSGLDFAAMRREMGIEPGRPILETIDTMDDERAAHCREILARHEWAGATSARLMPGVREFLASLAARDIHSAVLTRNGREVALSTLRRLELDFDTVFARGCAGETQPGGNLANLREMAIVRQRSRAGGRFSF